MKPRRNLKGAWSRLDILGFISDLKGLLTEAEKMYGNDIYCVTDRRIIGRDQVIHQKILVFFATDNAEKSEEMEKFLKEKIWRMLWLTMFHSEINFKKIIYEMFM